MTRVLFVALILWGLLHQDAHAQLAGPRVFLRGLGVPGFVPTEMPGFGHAPRSWEAERALCAAANLEPVSAQLLLRAGLPEALAAALMARVDAARTSDADAQLVNGETPFFVGNVGQALVAMRAEAFAALEAGALPESAGQAALRARTVLRAARLTGNLALRRSALDCLAPLAQYAVPREAPRWAGPLDPPNLLVAAHAVAAYMDAFYITGDRQYLLQAVVWATIGLPHIYFWSSMGDSAMPHNTISHFGAPVVSHGLVYAYALQDLADYDNSFDWRTIAQGITNSAMHQQYTDGPSKGCYPDSWNVLEATPNPADINPENIVLNECRLRGEGGQIRTERVPARVGEALVNTVFDIDAVLGRVGEGKLGLMLRGVPDFAAYTVVVPAQDPQRVEGAGARATDGAALAKVREGWLYDREAKALILKNTPETAEFRVEVTW